MLKGKDLFRDTILVICVLHGLWYLLLFYFLVLIQKKFYDLLHRRFTA
jgi:hypothetical protein